MEMHLHARSRAVDRGKLLPGQRSELLRVKAQDGMANTLPPIPSQSQIQAVSNLFEFGNPDVSIRPFKPQQRAPNARVLPCAPLPIDTAGLYVIIIRQAGWRT